MVLLGFVITSGERPLESAQIFEYSIRLTISFII